MRCVLADPRHMDVPVEDLNLCGDIDEDDYNLLYDVVAGVGP